MIGGDDDFKRAEREQIERDRKEGCKCEQPEPRGKVDKAQGQAFKPLADCPVHGWMVTQ